MRVAITATRSSPYSKACDKNTGETLLYDVRATPVRAKSNATCGHGKATAVCFTAELIARKRQTLDKCMTASKYPVQLACTVSAALVLPT